MILEIRNPIYANEEHTLINFEVKFQFSSNEWLPFTYAPNQTEDHFKWIEDNWLSVQENLDSISPYVRTEIESIVPQKVTRRQAKQALLLAGLLDQVQPAIDAIADPNERAFAQIFWDDSLDFERQNLVLIQLGTALGLSSTELDDLFVKASQL